MKKLFLITVIISVSLTACKSRAVSTNSVEDNTEYIIVDAGHGGFDGGAVAVDGTNEKDINLEIALKLGEMLNLCGKKVVYTRTEDTALDIAGNSVKKKKTSDMMYRYSLTEKYKKCVFLSIHQNKFTSTSVKGAQVFYSGKFEDEKELAEKIQKNIFEFVQPYNLRIPKKADKNIYLLYNAKVPSLIVECAFISNQNELNDIKDSNYQKKIAFCIVKSIFER